MLLQLRKKGYFFYVVALLLLVGLLCSICYSKANGFILLHPYHAKWLDIFFVAFTYVGDGWVSVIAVLLLFIFKKRKEAFLLLFAFVMSGLLSATIKNVFLMPRPKLFFEINGIAFQYFIDGITLANYRSFPSGHTTSAFALATVFVFLHNKKYVHILLALLAILAGYSRIYLGQHFLQDVVAGSFLGIGSALLGYYFIIFKELKIRLPWKGFPKRNQILRSWN